MRVCRQGPSIFSGWRAEGEISNAVLPKTSPFITFQNKAGARMYCQRDKFQIPRRSIHAPSGQQTPLRGGLRRNKSARLQRWCGILLLQACAQKQNKRVRGIGGNGTGSMSTGGERGGQGGAQNPLMPTLRSRSRHRAELLCGKAG